MNFLKLLITGATVAVGVYYVTRKRPDGSSLLTDLSENTGDLFEKARTYGDAFKSRLLKRGSFFNGGGSDLQYPEKFDNFSPDPDPSYSS